MLGGQLGIGKLSGKFLERTFQGLAIFTFVSMCWLFHRAFSARTECIRSQFVSQMRSEGWTLSSCRVESRLMLQHVFERPSVDTVDFIRRMESIDALHSLWPGQAPQVQVEVTDTEPFLFEMSPGRVKMGRELARAKGQLERAVVIALLNSYFAPTSRSEYEIEVTADFLLINVLGLTDLQDPSAGDLVSFDRDTSFALTDRSINEYCNSSWRSLTHFMMCSLHSPGHRAHDVSSWGTRPLIAKLLSRVYGELGLGERVEMMRGVFNPEPLAPVKPLADTGALSLALWTVDQTRTFLMGWKMPLNNERVSFFLQKALMLERVFHVTQWDYTVEITSSANWERLWHSLRQWSQLHPSQRILVWNPVGSFALPEGASVSWSKDDVKTQKHLLIACRWPESKGTVGVTARHFVALQVCEEAQIPRWGDVLTPTKEQARVSF